MDGLCGNRRYRIRAGALKALTRLKDQMRVSVFVALTLTFQTWSARCQATLRLDVEIAAWQRADQVWKVNVSATKTETLI